MKKSLILFLILFVSIQAFGQNISIEGVTRFSTRGVGEIISSDYQVKGYYTFYQLDKADKKNFNYVLQLHDENLKEINQISIVRPKHYYLIESGYNGDAFALLFYDVKKKSIELVSYDKTLKQLGTVVKVLKDRMSVTSFNNMARGIDSGHEFLVAVEKRGFLYYGFAETKGYKYSINFYDNSLKEGWSSASKDFASKEVEFAEEAFQSSQYVGSLVSKKNNLFSKDQNYDLMVNEISAGKELFKMEVADPAYNVSASKITFDESNKTIMIFGEYYGIKDKEFKSGSLGYFYFVVGLDGKINNKKWVSWEKDMSKVMAVDKTGKMEKGARVFVHEIVKTSDGDVFVIGEEYKKAASGAGIAMAAMMGSRSNTATVQIEILNLVIFQFDSKLDIKKVHTYEKHRSAHLLPSGFEWVSSKMLAYYASNNEWFDVNFIQVNKEKSSFMVSYTNYDKQKGEKGKNVLGTVVFTPEKELKTDKTTLNRKSTNFYIRKAKHGYVLVTEYFKKEKRIESRLEKVNY